MRLRIKTFFLDNRDRIFLFLGIVLVGGLCFEAGLLRGRMKQATPVVLSVPQVPTASLQISGLPSSPRSADARVSVGQEATKNETRECVFVGSKNSDKYHLPTCAVAKRIKPENRVCFTSKEEALERGYVPSCLK